MSTQQQIRDAIKTKMLTVAGVALVHTFERFAENLAKLKPLYVTGGKINGWYIRLQKTSRSSPFMGRIKVVHTWQIRGFMSLDDATTSELTFDALVEAMQLAFKADETIGGVVAATVLEDTDGGPAGLQRDDAGPVMFCNVLCHSATLRLLTRHEE
jgi:hypothetical protein